MIIKISILDCDTIDLIRLHNAAFIPFKKLLN